MIRSNTYLVLIFILSITQLLGQPIEYAGPQDQAGDPLNERLCYMTSNRVLLTTKNTTEMSGWHPFTSTHKWPNNVDGLNMTDGMAFMVAARIYINNSGTIDTIPVTDQDIIDTDSSLHVLHYLQTSYREEMDVNLEGSTTWGFHPASGYFRETSEYPAMSNRQETWPTEGWPSNEGLIGAGQWFGREGLGISNADLETYFVVNDAQDQEYIGVEDSVRYYPRPGLLIGDLGPNSTQLGNPWGGLGIRVAIRGYQWNEPQVRDIVFWEYEIANLSDYDLTEVILGHWIDSGIGGADGDDDLCHSIDSLSLVYSWDINGIGLGGLTTGSFAMLYSGDSITSKLSTCRIFPVPSHANSSETTWFKNDRAMWNLMDSQAFESTDVTINLISVIASEKFALPANTQVGLNFAILHAFEELDGLNSDEHSAPNLINLKHLANEVVENEYRLDEVISIGDNGEIPTQFIIFQNYPNPFNPTTTISYDLPEQSLVKLTVFDIRGQEIKMLHNADKPPGNYEVQWSGMDQQGNQVSTGVYFARLQAGDYSKTIKMVYLR